MLRMFIAYVVGSLLREVGVTPTFAPVRAGAAVAEVDPALFPVVSELRPHLDSCDHDEEFEFGLELLVQAMAVRAAARADAQAGGGEGERGGERAGRGGARQ